MEQSFRIEHKVVIHTDWRGYQAMIDIVGEQPALRLTYDRGELEIMTVSGEHGRKKSMAGRLLEALMIELDVDFMCGRRRFPARTSTAASSQTPATARVPERDP